MISRVHKFVPVRTILVVAPSEIGEQELEGHTQRRMIKEWTNNRANNANTNGENVTLDNFLRRA